jgi:hypothetical protein
MDLQPILNKNSPQALTKLKLDVLGVAEELMKYVVHLSKRKIEKTCFSSHIVPKQQTISLWSQRIFRINKKNSSSSYKSKGGIWAMCGQFDLEVICKRSKKEGRPPIFHKFWNEDVHSNKDPPKRKVSCLNFIS